MTEPILLTKPDLRLRHEYKHIISEGEAFVLGQRLKKLFAADSHAGADGSYRVCSLYFDTPSDTFLRQKLDGTDKREKFRFRYYGEDTSFIRLEKKLKRGGLCGKLSERLTLEQVKEILRGDYECLLGTGALGHEFYARLTGGALRAKTCVVYDREAYVFEPGNVRITLDRRLGFYHNALDFLKPRRELSAGESGVVLEVKYDEFLPELVKAAVQTENTRAGAYSKYAVCRRYD